MKRLKERQSFIFEVYCVVFLGCTNAVTRCHSLLFVVTRCHSLYNFLSLFVTCCTTRCHSLSFVVTRCTPRCHSLYHSLSLVVIRCHSLYHSLSIVVIRCHSLSFDVPFVCLFINDQIFIQHWRQNVSQWIKIKNVTSSKSLALS